MSDIDFTALRATRATQPGRDCAGTRFSKQTRHRQR